MIKKELSPKQQAVELIKGNKEFLIIPHANPDGDAVSSALALRLVLEKMGKKADIAIPDEIPNNCSFLPGIDRIIKEKRINRDLIINLKNKVGKISYDKKADGTIDLIITPAEDEIRENDVELKFGKSNYDVLIVLDTPNKERANDFFETNRAFLDQLPTINIDHHPTNNIFGSINIVDTTATSTCEIVFSLVEALDKNLIDETVATLLLTGIISDTNRFQNANTTPKSLTVAAQLIASGANRPDIVKNMFHTKNISTLKLWGKILSGIKEDKENKLVWSTVSSKEISEAGASPSEIEGAIDELLTSTPGAKVIMLLTERAPGMITVSMRTPLDNIELDAIALSFGGGGHKKAAGFKLENISLSEAEDIVLTRIRSLSNKGVSPNTQVSPEKPMPKKEVSSASSEPVKTPPKIAVPEPLEEKKMAIKSDASFSVSEDDLYAPSLSDIELDKPKIVDNGGQPQERPRTSILQKLVEDKKKKKDDEEIDFAKMEQEVRRKGETGENLAEDEGSDAFDDDFDEDYE